VTISFIQLLWSTYKIRWPIFPLAVNSKKTGGIFMTRPTWLKAVPIALVIVAIVFLLVVGPDFAFGIKTG
jgi:hypothetical protein